MCSMGDLFHEAVPDQFIEQVFDTILETAHTYQILTKRPERMRRFVESYLAPSMKEELLRDIWLGVSVENQQTADERIPLLLQPAAAVRFVSYEPALEPVDLRPYLPHVIWDPSLPEFIVSPALSWVIAGGESGPKARPSDPDWFRSVREQCKAAGVPFFMKQMSGKGPIPDDLMIRQWPGAARVVAEEPWQRTTGTQPIP